MLTLPSSSGQQLLTAIQPKVSTLVHLIRQGNWITGPFGDAPRTYSQEEIAEFESNAEKLLAKRKKVEEVINSTFSSFISNSPLQAGMRHCLAQAMESKIASGSLPHQLLPTFAPGCRRPTPGVGYLEALSQPNAEVIVGEIERINERGVIDHTGREHQVNAIICATGFNTSFIPSFKMTGLNGQTLDSLWAEDVTDSYFATTVPFMPNYAVFAGPFSPSVSGSYVRNIGLAPSFLSVLSPN